MVRTLFFALILTATTAWAGEPDVAGMHTLDSRYTVSATMQRLEAGIAQRGMSVIAKVDHAAGAEEMQMVLPKTILVLFGNPKAGTPLMQDTRSIGIDLPMKALVWVDEKGVHVSWNDPRHLGERHGLKDDPRMVKMAAVMEGLVEEATGRELAVAE